jgi:hypothetical protein
MRLGNNGSNSFLRLMALANLALLFCMLAPVPTAYAHD